MAATDGAAGGGRRLRVEVVYARPEQQLLVPLELPEGATVRDALDRSGLLQRFPEIDLKVNRIGIFGKLTKLENPLQSRDRVEIYRPLIADPKAVRKQRAAAGKQMRKGAGSQSSESESGDS